MSAPGEPTLIGIDFGGTAIKLGRVDSGTIAEGRTIATPVGATPARVFDAIAEIVKELDPSPATIGMAIPGEVDGEGRCYRLPNVPGFEGVEMARELELRTGARVRVENDGYCAALGELLHGHGAEYASFAVVALGTGVGGGLVMNRRVVRGAKGFAAEIGHITIDASPDAPPCGCGNRGCLEAYAGTEALLRVHRSAGGTCTTAAEVAGSARRGETAGLDAFATLARALAIGVNTIQNLLDLDAFVFTGGIANSFDLIEPTLRAELRRRCFAKVLGEVPFVVSRLGDRAGVVGAASLWAEG